MLRATDPRALHGPSWLSFLLPPEDEDDDEEEEDSLHMARGCSSHAGAQAGSRARGTRAAPLQQHRGERGSEGDPAGTPLPPSGTSPPVSPSSPRGGVITGASGEMTCRSALAEKGLSIL